MSIRFTGSTFDTLAQASPLIRPVPFTIGFWVYPMGTGIPVSIGGDTDIGYRIENSATSANWSMKYYNGANVGQAEIVGGGVLNAWQYLIFRYIADNNRRMSVLSRAGVSHANSTASITPGTMTKMTLGAIKGSTEYGYYTGAVGEFFFADMDVMPGGGVMNEHLLRQLAFGGPFSVTHVAPNVVEYMSFEKGISSRDATRGEAYQRVHGRSWLPANSPKLWEHPPLPPSYVKPNRRARHLMIA